mgnify:CR=1 FL=1
MKDRLKFRYYDEKLKQMIEIDAFGGIKNPLQCTGLKDKNGKLIYEGDILYENMINTVFPKGKYWIVEWNNNTAQFFIELINKTGNSLTDTWHLARHSYDYEVIGNIYENPELLED